MIAVGGRVPLVGRLAGVRVRGREGVGSEVVVKLGTNVSRE